MTRGELIDYLRRNASCRGAREWATATLGTPEELWHACKRGDWLLWFAASAGVDKRLVVVVACDCAEEATPYLAASTRGPALKALETARRWARGEATEAEVRAAADATAYAAYAATTSAARATYATADAATADAIAAYAAADVAYAAIAAYAADVAADAADATERAASATAVCAAERAADSKNASLQRSADLVRARIPWADVEAALLRGTP